MKKSIQLLAMITLLVGVMNCQTTENAGDDTRPKTEIGNADDRNYYDPSVDLTSHIQQLAGVSVTGSGAAAQFSIRGSEGNSFYGNTQPLFVVNDLPMVRGYGFVYNTVSVGDIISIKVLKGSDAAIYGSRGFNGVILIKTN
jgi:TonB-dependent SusC/RagA subfamily outer membrane receptor